MMIGIISKYSVYENSILHQALLSSNTRNTHVLCPGTMLWSFNSQQPGDASETHLLKESLVVIRLLLYRLTARNQHRQSFEKPRGTVPSRNYNAIHYGLNECRLRIPAALNASA